MGSFRIYLTRDEVLRMMMLAYESAVVVVAIQRGHKPRDFLEAAGMLPEAEFEEMRDSFARQIAELS